MDLSVPISAGTDAKTSEAHQNLPSAGDHDLLLDNVAAEGLTAPGTPTHSTNSYPVDHELKEMASRESDGNSICQADLSLTLQLLSSKLTNPPDCIAAGVNTQETPSLSKGRKRVFEKGNYSRYYGYRLGAGESEDSRLKVLNKKWFAGKKCMDIGCNAGVLTLAVVRKYLPAKMVGIDIDTALASRASNNLSKVRRSLDEELKGKTSPSRGRILRAEMSSLANTWFQQGDLVKSNFPAGGFDTIMCMSVTKWIHMHEGDQFMKTFFGRVKELLSPGGNFVVEPQPWSSYKSATRKLKADNLEHVPLTSIHFRPEQFLEFLTNDLGFRLIESSQNPSEKQGFRRPIYCFRKQ